MNMRPIVRAVPGITLSLLLLSACGDMTFNGNYQTGGFTPASWPWFSESDVIATTTVTMEEPVENGQGLRLDARSGSVAVFGDPLRETLQLTATLVVGSHSYEDALAGLEDLEVATTPSPDEVHIRTIQPGTPDGRHYAVEYTLAVPADMRVLVIQTNGSILIEDVNGSVQIEALNGDLLLQDLGGPALADVHNGNIDATLSLPPGAETVLSTVNGRVDLRTPVTTSAVLSALAGNGVITWHDLELGDLQAGDGWLYGILGSGDGRIDLETVNGNIAVWGY